MSPVPFNHQAVSSRRASRAQSSLFLLALLAGCSDPQPAGVSGVPASVSGAGGQVAPAGGQSGAPGQLEAGGGQGGSASGGVGSGGMGGSQAGSSMSSGGTVLVGGSTGTSTGGGAGTSGAPQVSPGACPFALCETFEDAAVGSPPSSAVWKSAAGIVVDTVHAFRGTKALHVPPIKTGHFMIETTKGLPLPGKVMFGRVYLWIENTPKLGGSYLHQSFVTASGKNAAGADMDHYFGGQSRSGWEGAFTFPSYNSWSGSGGHGGPANAHHPVGFKVKSWECLEWSYDTPQNKATFWNNGTELTAIGFTNAGKPVYDFPEMRAIAIGVTEFHSGDAPWEVWFDEFAIGPTRIGCLP